jgi:cytochrome c
MGELILTRGFDIQNCQYIITNNNPTPQLQVRESHVSVKVIVLALVTSAVVLPSGGASAQDAAKGEQVFKQCMTCHRIGPDAKNLIGPVLTGVIGRPSGTAPGFAYSALNKAAGENGLVWSDDLIMEYLPDPNAFLKKFLTDKGKPDLAVGQTKMTFHLADEQQRKDVIAYINKFSDKK